MKITTSSPIIALSGHTANSCLVPYTRGKQLVARAWIKTPNPQTPDQRLTRAYQTHAARHWANITTAQRSDWQAFAEHHYPNTTLTGYLLFRRIQFIRQAQSLPLSADAPMFPPPPPPRAITQQPATNPTEFQFQIQHTQTGSLTGYKIRFDITPAMPSPARTPRPNELRLIRGLTPNSFLELQPNNATYTIPNARYAIAPTQRYATRITILTPDSLPSLPFTADLIRI